VALRNLLGLGNRGPLLVGAALAMTPALLFFGASINPSGLSIAAAMAVWTGGFALVRTEKIPDVSVALARVGGPLCLLLLLRRDSLLWAGLIVLALIAITPPMRRRELMALRTTWAWGLAVGACALAQYATGGADTARLAREAANGSVSGAWAELPAYIREIGGGILGWRDTPVPSFVTHVFIAGTVVLALIALVVGPRRVAMTLAALVVVVVTAPLAIGALLYPYFQGRYMLPLAIGVVLLAALGLSETKPSRLWPPAVPAVTLTFIGAAQIDAFAQTLRRHTIGYHGGWYFTHAPAWHPPAAGPISLTITYAALVAAVLAWIFLLSLEEVGPIERAAASTGADAEAVRVDVVAVA
jgi:hypothetical protein